MGSGSFGAVVPQQRRPRRDEPGGDAGKTIDLYSALSELRLTDQPPTHCHIGAPGEVSACSCPPHAKPVTAPQVTLLGEFGGGAFQGAFGTEGVSKSSWWAGGGDALRLAFQLAPPASSVNTVALGDHTLGMAVTAVSSVVCAGRASADLAAAPFRVLAEAFPPAVARRFADICQLRCRAWASMEAQGAPRRWRHRFASDEVGVVATAMMSSPAIARLVGTLVPCDATLVRSDPDPDPGGGGRGDGGGGGLIGGVGVIGASGGHSDGRRGRSDGCGDGRDSDDSGRADGGDQRWHADVGPEEHYFTVIIPLEPVVSAANGATQFAFNVDDGSPAICDALPGQCWLPDITRHTLRVPTLRLGDALVFPGSQMHRGLANRSPAPRTILYVALAHRGFVDRNRIL